MAITSMRVSYLANRITVKILEGDVPESGQPLPFLITSMPTLIPIPPIPAPTPTPMILAGLTPTLPLDGFVSYAITADPTLSYMVSVPNPYGTTVGTSTGPSTPFLMKGEEYSLLPGPNGGNDLIFKNLDPVGPLLQTLTTLNEYNIANPGNTVETPGSADGKAYFVAKFNEAINQPSPMNFNVSQNGVSSQAQQVQALWQTGNVLSTTTTTNLPLSSVYLVTVNVPQGSAGTPAVTLVPAPPTITIVQEMAARPLVSEMDSGNSAGQQLIGMGPSESWLKVTLEGSAGQFLLGQNSPIPRLQYTFAPDDGWPGYTRDFSPDYAVRSVNNPSVIYLGFRSSQLGPSDNPDSIAFITSVPPITDRAGNIIGSSGSRQTPQYLDAAGEQVFSSVWEGDTTTITNASVYGYSNGANVLVDAFGGKTYLNGYDPLLPSFFTDGKPLGEDADGNPTYGVYGYRIGMDTIDLSGITGGPMIINAELGQAFVYSGVDSEEALVLDVSDYDRYILNDRASDSLDYGNAFYGTEDSEYVVVGSGGDNYLEAGNLQDPTDISADIKVKNFQFDTDGIVRETDIVDYSQLNTGITVHLGDDASEEVFVLYDDDTDSDIIIGFEGVVGSGGDDVISGSNVGNVLVGGAGKDVLMGYTDTNGAGDKLYEQAYLNNWYKGPDKNGDFQAAQFLVDSSDILYGGAGDDDIFGGAGRDMLIDLGKAEMLGSDKTGFSGDGVTTGLRDSKNKDIAENDVFWVRGDGAEKATINNFHLSKDGTGLAGRSNSANDAIMFSIDTTKLFGAMASMNTSIMTDEALYNSVYSRLTFEQIHNNVNDDIELVVNFKKDNYSEEIKVGSTIIADIGSMLNGGANRAEVVELKWLSKGDDPLYLFNPKIDMDLADFVETDEFGPSMNIAVALELLQAGTVRGTNDYGVMAAKLSDNDLDERVYNPGDKDDRILGTASDDSYEYIVQQFTPTPITPPGEPPPTIPAVITNQVGKDAIFDTGGDDVLMFESARIQDLVFSAVKVGRESKANSLKVVHNQKEALDDGDVKNEGEVVWQGHYKEGGRQAAEVLKIKGGEFEIAQAVYDYNAKGYAKGGPEITATSARDVIMVGQGAGDKFVFDFTPAPVSTGIEQTARIAGFGQNDKIDVSQFGDLADGGFTKNLAGQNSTVKLEFETGFVLNLSFQDSVSDADLNFALSSILT